MKGEDDGSASAASLELNYIIMTSPHQLIKGVSVKNSNPLYSLHLFEDDVS